MIRRERRSCVITLVKMKRNNKIDDNKIKREMRDNEKKEHLKERGQQKKKRKA